MYSRFNFFHILFQNWISDLEIFTCLVAAMIHDFDHTGTTNNFHVNSASKLAILYNDRAVLENHHVSAFFRSVFDRTDHNSQVFGHTVHNSDYNKHLLILSWLKSLPSCVNISS